LFAKGGDARGVHKEAVVLHAGEHGGERLLDIKSAEALYKVLGGVCPSKKGYKYNIISSDDNFEACFGRPADKRRKLYNGSIRCQLYMYFK